MEGPRGAAGAHSQRPLWASTGVKDPAYDDTDVRDRVVAPDTVNTMPEATLNAVEDHGVITGDAVRGSYATAQKVLLDSAAIGIDYHDVVKVLEIEGVQKFEDAWKQLLEGVQAQLDAARPA